MRIAAIGGGCQTSVFGVANVIQPPQYCCVYRNVGPAYARALALTSSFGGLFSFWDMFGDPV